MANAGNEQLQQDLIETLLRMEMFLEQAEIERRRANLLRNQIEEVNNGRKNNG